MLEASYEQVMIWLKQFKREMDLGELPEDDTAEECNFND